MNDKYIDDDKSDDIRSAIKPWVPVLSITLTGVSVAIYFAIYASGQGFVDLYQGFGADLPGLTSIILKSYNYFGLLAIIGLIPCVILLLNRSLSVADGNRLFAVVLTGFGLSVAILVLFVWAVYLPVFKLGSVV